MKLVPSVRLLLWTALAFVPAATLGFALPSAAPAAGAIAAAFFVLTFVDGVLGTRSLRGIRIELPPSVRLLKGRAGEIEVGIRNLRRTARMLRLALDVPPDLVLEKEDVLIRLPAGAEFSRIEAALTPRRRGNFRIENCHAETASPLGFWDVRQALPVDAEIRVYPNLASERHSMAALFLNRGGLGVHAQRQIGKGREFEKLRGYLPGDSVDDIHWKATAKRGEPVTKVFQLERTQEIYVIIDASRLSGRLAPADPAAVPAAASSAQDAPDDNGIPVTALERFVTSALVVGAAAERQGDLFGLITFSDRIHSFLRARSGKAHYSACRDALYNLEPQIVSPDYNELFTFIRLRLRRRALLVFVTALDDPILAESFARNVELICRQHLVLVNMLRPSGAEALFSRADVDTVDDVYRRLGGHLVWQELRELEMTFKSRGVRFSLLENERLSAQLVTQYLSVKQRQMI